MIKMNEYIDNLAKKIEEIIDAFKIGSYTTNIEPLKSLISLRKEYIHNYEKFSRNEREDIQGLFYACDNYIKDKLEYTRAESIIGFYKSLDKNARRFHDTMSYEDKIAHDLEVIANKITSSNEKHVKLIDIVEEFNELCLHYLRNYSKVDISQKQLLESQFNLTHLAITNKQEVIEVRDLMKLVDGKK